MAAWRAFPDMKPDVTLVREEENSVGGTARSPADVT
jgi:hypothetical protein